VWLEARDRRLANSSALCQGQVQGFALIVEEPISRCCWLFNGFREKSSATPHPTPPLHAPTRARGNKIVLLALQGFAQNSCAEPERRRGARARCRVGVSNGADGLLVRVGTHALRLRFDAPRLP